MANAARRERSQCGVRPRGKGEEQARRSPPRSKDAGEGAPRPSSSARKGAGGGDELRAEGSPRDLSLGGGIARGRGRGVAGFRRPHGREVPPRSLHGNGDVDSFRPGGRGVATRRTDERAIDEQSGLPRAGKRHQPSRSELRKARDQRSDDGVPHAGRDDVSLFHVFAHMQGTGRVPCVVDARLSRRIRLDARHVAR